MENKLGAIIVNAFILRDSTIYQINRLIEEFKEVNVSIDVISNIDIFIYIDNEGKITNKLKKYDFIIYLDKDKYISELLEKERYILFNNSKSIIDCDDKMLTHIKLSNNNIMMPKTISYPLNYFNNESKFIEFKNKILKEFTFPFLIKENFGSLGKQVYLINNLDDFNLIEEKLKYTPHIFQEFIQESKGTDYRVFLINKKPVAYMKRVNNNSYVSNVAAGGVGYTFTPNKQIIKDATKASKLLKLDYCAVDFVLDKSGKYILIEVNSNAFFTEIEKISKVNIAKIYCDFIYNKIYKK